MIVEKPKIRGPISENTGIDSLKGIIRGEHISTHGTSASLKSEEADPIRDAIRRIESAITSNGIPVPRYMF